MGSASTFSEEEPQQQFGWAVQVSASPSSRARAAASSPQGHAALRVLQVFGSCGGRGVVIGRDPRASAVSEVPDPELALASLLSEREAEGARDLTVVLRVGVRSDAGWVAQAMHWLAARGRRVVLRTRVVLPKSVIECVRELGAPVFLELAGRKPEVQRALLGEHAEPVARLLLHAQHLRGSGIPVAAMIGPVLGVLHDRVEGLGPLLKHVAVADLSDVHIGVGRLTQSRFRALSNSLPWSDMTAIGRAYGVYDGNVDAIPATGVRLPDRDAEAVFHNARRHAEAAGLRVDACGCAALCHLGHAKPKPFLPLLAPELFTDAS